MTVQPTTPAPGPGSRVTRTAGQLGGALVLIELWIAFGWLGAGDWTDRQTLAVYAVSAFAVAAAQNLLNARSGQVEVAPIEPAAVEVVDDDDLVDIDERLGGYDGE